MNFFVTGIGHSGTMWLAKVLGCPHETPDARCKVTPHAWSPFPVERFWAGGQDYGEVNGMLRYHLSAQFRGMERLIPRRAWLRRNPKAIIRSWMNDSVKRKPWELPFVCFEVLWHYRNLSEWVAIDKDAKVFDLETISTNPLRLAEACEWLGRPKIVKTADLVPVRPTPKENQWFEWGKDELEVFRTIAARVGLTAAVEGATFDT